MAPRLFALAALAVAMLAAPAWAQNLERARDLYGLCTQCHMADGGGNRLALAPPPLAGL